MSSPLLQRFPRSVMVLALLGVFTLSIVAGARLARHKGLQLVHASADARGWGLETTGVRTRLDGRVRFDSLCISLLDDDHQDLCLDDLRVHVSPVSALRRQLAIDAVTAAAMRIDTDVDRLRQFRSSEQGSGEEPSRRRRLSSLNRVQLDDVTVTLRDAKRSLSAQLQTLALEADDTGWKLQADGQLHAVEGADELIGAALAGLTGQAFELNSYWDREEAQLRDASLRFETPVVVALKLREHVDLTLSGLAFVQPYSVRILEPSASLPEHGLALKAEAVETEVGHWTTHLPDLYLASMTIESPVLDVPTSKARETLSMLRALSAELLAERHAALAGAGEDTNPEEDAQGADTNGADNKSNANGANTANDANGTVGAPQNNQARTDQELTRGPRARSLRDELAARRWWEVVPRAIRVEDAAIRFHPDEGDVATLRLEDLSVQYGLRVLQRQIDIVISGQLRNGDADAGHVQVQTAWDYDRKIARVDWEFTALDLVVLRGLVPSKRLQLHSGLLHLEGRLRTSADAGLSGTHATRIEALHIEHPRLQEGLKVQHAASAGPILMEREGGRATLSLVNQALELEEARAELSLVFNDFRLLQQPRASQVTVLFEVPDQPAMRLFSAIPVSLRGPVAETQMSGPWGLTLGFVVEHTGSLDDGRPLWEIGAPTVYRLRDRELVLDSLPDAVDVRRLNGAMSFTFRGPNDEMMKPLRIPAPHRGYDGETSASSWVPLRAMSYYFVATQLYREDGSFFRNTGINWLQLRRVLSEALTTRQLTRGASTITMQTVKNVFLSHERSIERKLQELFLAYWMTRVVAKERILEVYLNIIELGPNRNGADEASRFHFRTSIQELPLRESVWLSSISPNPVRIGGTQPKGEVPFGSCVRCDRLIDGLYKRAWINAAEHRAGLGDAEPPASLPFDVQNLLDLDTPPLFDMLNEDVTPNSVDRLPVEQRLSRWIQESRTLRGAGASPR